MAFDLQVDVYGAQEIIAGFEGFGSDLERYVYDKILQWAEMVRQEAEFIVPVRSGFLRSTIFVEVEGWVAKFGAYAPYAAFVEKGTRRIMARPFIEPAVQRFLPELENLILSAIDEAKVRAGFQ